MNRRILTSMIAVLLVGFLVVGFYSIGSNDHGSKTITNPEQQVKNPELPVYDLPPVYTDDFDLPNDTNALKARGYKVWYRGTGPQGLTATWFQGSTPFNAFNGCTTCYVAANYNAVTGTNNIDSWLVLPRIAGGLLTGDSLYFYSRSPTASTYPDSIRVMFSANDSVPEGSWTELGRFKVNIAGTWERRGFRAPSTSVNGRFAIRYCVVNGGPNGANSDYIGIDALSIQRSGTPPPTGCSNYSSTWCPLGTYPNIPVATYFQAATWLGDTLYVHAPPAGAATAVIYRYVLGGGWTTGVSMPSALVGGALTTVGGKLYYTGGGTSTITTGTTTCYEYTPSTGTWATKAPMPAALAGHGAGNWGDSVLFVAGGPYTGPTANVYFYRPATNTWGTSTPFTGVRRTFAFGISGNKMFVCAGYNGSAFIKTFQIGTINSASSITWVAGPDVPTALAGLSRPGGVAISNLFYLVGGEMAGGGYSNITYIWSIPGAGWLATQPLKPTGMSNIFNGCAAKCVNDTAKIFVPGGYNGAGLGNFEVLGCGPGLIVGTQNPGTEIPSVYSLSQNYPNPFNPSTKISFALPKAGNVKLVVFDLLGREVVTLVNDFRTAGNHTIDFNASSFASGVYFYRIEAGDFTATKKMLLVK